MRLRPSVPSSVTSAGAVSRKTLEVRDVALPSVADLLAALGLDLPELPVETLDQLVERLELVDGAVRAAEQALGDAQARLKAPTDAATAELARQVAAVDAAQEELTARTGALAPLEAALLEKNAALAAANRAVADTAAALTAAQDAAAPKTSAYAALQATYDATPALLQPPLRPALDLARAAADEAAALVAAAQTAATTAAAAVPSATSAAALARAAVDAARAAVALAQAALDAADRLLTAARAALAALGSQLAPLVRQLVAALVAVLDGTPLVALDSLTVATEAATTGAAAGAQRATVTGGEVQGLRVLGSDVHRALPGRLGRDPGRGRPRHRPPGTGSPTSGSPTTGSPVAGSPVAGPGTVPGTLPRTGAEAGLAGLGLALLAGAVALRRRATSEPA